MLKLITILAAMIPVILFVKNVFFKRSKVLQQASAEIRKQVDYLVWGILILIGLGLLYSLGRLVYTMLG
jgi:MFS-type transporter involved in bile tolerance (Atg22 family)